MRLALTRPSRATRLSFSLATPWIVGACACLLVATADARHGDPPASRSVGVASLDQVPVLAFPAVDHAALQEEDAAAPKDTPSRYAFPQQVSVTPATDGLWETLPDGSGLWRLRVFSPGATDLNFGFTQYWLPEGATLHVSSESEDYYEGPYTARDDGEARQLWTPVIPGDRAIIELHVPSTKNLPLLELGQVGHGYTDLFHRFDPAIPKSGSCNIDVICPQGDPWRDEINSVGRISIGGNGFCTGTMIMDVPRDFRPFFLSANHCDFTAANASTIVVYWNYQVTTCAGPRDGSLADNQSGSTFRASCCGPTPQTNGSDFALIELSQMPDPAWNVYWAGWDRSGTAPASTVSISHPNADEKAITLNNLPLTTGNSCIGSGNNTHWIVQRYAQGTTEPGSSGCGIWDVATHLLVGHLSGGGASCSSPNLGDCYGRFQVDWDTGTTPDTRSKDWLDANNTGATSETGAYPNATVTYVSHATQDSCTYGAGDGNGVWEPGETITVPVTLVSTGSFTNVQGTLGTTTSGVTITTSTATWPNLTSSVPTVSNAPHFVVALDPSMPCGTDVSFTLHVTTNEGGPFDLSFQDHVGKPFGPTDVPVPIPDQGTGTSNLVVTQAGTANGLKVYVKLNHTYIGDVTLSVVSPTGTSVRLFNRPSNGNGNCPDANLDATFDDAAPTAAESHCSGTTPWLSGTASPTQALAAFNGEALAGAWQLVANDGAAGDSGTILDWHIVTTPPIGDTCLICSPSASMTLAKTNDAPACLDPGARVNYTLTVTNTGASPATTWSLSDPLPVVLSGVLATPPLTASGNTVSLAAGPTLAAGESRTYTYSATTGCTGSGSATNTATLTYTGPTPVTSSSSVTWGLPDFTSSGMTLDSFDANGNGSTDPGENVQYTLTVANSGTCDARGVVVTDALDARFDPATVAFVAGTGSVAAGTITWDATTVPALADVAPASSVALTFTVQVLAATPPNQQIPNSFSVRATGNSVAACPGLSSPDRVGVAAGGANGGLDPWRLSSATVDLLRNAAITSLTTAHQQMRAIFANGSNNTTTCGSVSLDRTADLAQPNVGAQLPTGVRVTGDAAVGSGPLIFYQVTEWCTRAEGGVLDGLAVSKSGQDVIVAALPNH